MIDREWVGFTVYRGVGSSEKLRGNVYKFDEEGTKFLRIKEFWHGVISGGHTSYSSKLLFLPIADDILMVKLPMKPVKDFNDVCSPSACNSLFVDVNIHGQHVSLGECGYGIGPKNLKFCFVSGDSVCPKTLFKMLPGTYYSTLPCANSPTPFKPNFGYLIG